MAYTNLKCELLMKPIELMYFNNTSHGQICEEMPQGYIYFMFVCIS
uniref:Uncharacterized protein n=1 Tax=Anguilla anguilla TaxID=7936 RepID=A0A0E9Q5C8_ANGAN